MKPIAYLHRENGNICAECAQKYQLMVEACRPRYFYHQLMDNFCSMCVQSFASKSEADTQQDVARCV